MENFKEIIVVLGATATGKTGFSVNLAKLLNAEIISADSRQVYKHMDIGTGKDIEEYNLDGIKVPYHLIDIVEPGTKYNVYKYQEDFLSVYNKIQNKHKNIILCGGSGMYIEAILQGYKLINVPINEEFRKKCEIKSDNELIQMLKSVRRLHNVSDILSRKRLIRALEISLFYSENIKDKTSFPELKYFIIGINFDRLQIRKRITERLKERLSNGMIEEVNSLLKNGISPETLMYYGLEYKFITMHITGELSYDEMFTKLNTAIHQFSKRQMTWFRRMEKRGMHINWIDGYLSMNEKTDRAISLLNAKGLF